MSKRTIARQRKRQTNNMCHEHTDVGISTDKMMSAESVASLVIITMLNLNRNRASQRLVIVASLQTAKKTSSFILVAKLVTSSSMKRTVSSINLYIGGRGFGLFPFFCFFH